jgi:hypothetical protein
MTESAEGKPVVDGLVQVAVDSTGKKIDNSVVIQDGGDTVYRERVNISDPVDPNAHARVQDFVDGLEQGLVTRDIYAKDILNALLYLTEEIHMLRQVMELHVGIKGD